MSYPKNGKSGQVKTLRELNFQDQSSHSRRQFKQLTQMLLLMQAKMESSSTLSCGV